MRITTGDGYADIEDNGTVLRFSGQDLGWAFTAIYSDSEWISGSGFKIGLAVDAVLYNSDMNATLPPSEQFCFGFRFRDVDSLVSVLLTIPHLKGSLSVVSDDSFEWTLPSGVCMTIVLSEIVNRKGEVSIRQWDVFPRYEDAVCQQWHTEEEDIFSDIVLINYGRMFWVKDRKGRVVLMSKYDYDRMSEKSRSKYQIL